MAGLALYSGATSRLSVAMPWTALSYVAAVLIGHYGFAEPLATRQFAATALILTGVLALTPP